MKKKDNLNKKIEREKRTREGRELGDNFLVSLRGDYIFKEKNPYKSFLFIIDTIWVGIFYLLISLFLSAVMDEYTVRELNATGTSQNKGIVLLEIIAQFILLIFILYFTINFVPMFIPSLTKPTFEHKIFKSFIGGLFTTIGIVAGEHKLSEKIRYVFNTSVYKDGVNLNRLVDCANNGTLLNNCNMLN